MDRRTARDQRRMAVAQRQRDTLEHRLHEMQRTRAMGEAGEGGRKFGVVVRRAFAGQIGREDRRVGG